MPQNPVHSNYSGPYIIELLIRSSTHRRSSFQVSQGRATSASQGCTEWSERPADPAEAAAEACRAADLGVFRVAPFCRYHQGNSRKHNAKLKTLTCVGILCCSEAASSWGWGFGRPLSFEGALTVSGSRVQDGLGIGLLNSFFEIASALSLLKTTTQCKFPNPDMPPKPQTLTKPLSPKPQNLNP